MKKVLFRTFVVIGVLVLLALLALIVSYASLDDAERARIDSTSSSDWD